MGEIKNTTQEYKGTMTEMWKEYKEYLNEVKTLCIQTPKYIRKNEINNSLIISADPADHKFCDIYEQTIAWTVWIGKVSDAILKVPINTVSIVCRALGETLEYAMSIIEQGIEFATNWLVEKLSNLITKSKWIRKIVKWLKLTVLFAKKSILYGKLWIYKSLRWMIKAATTGKISSALQTAYAAVITWIQSSMKIIDTIMQVITNLLNSLIGFTLDGGAMGFFITPKSVLSGVIVPYPQLSMTPMNINQDIFTNIADTLISPIEESLRNATIAKMSGDNAKMVADITAGASSIVAGGDLVPISTPEVNPFDLGAFKAALANLLAMIALPEPLPKYERLHPANIGFMVWLITSFEPTMKRCFGFPMYP